MSGIVATYPPKSRIQVSALSVCVICLSLIRLWQIRQTSALIIPHILLDLIHDKLFNNMISKFDFLPISSLQHKFYLTPCHLHNQKVYHSCIKCYVYVHVQIPKTVVVHVYVFHKLKMPPIRENLAKLHIYVQGDKQNLAMPFIFKRNPMRTWIWQFHVHAANMRRLMIEKIDVEFLWNLILQSECTLTLTWI